MGRLAFGEATQVAAPTAMRNARPVGFEGKLAKLRELELAARQEFRHPRFTAWDGGADLVLVCDSGPEAFEATREWLWASLTTGMALNMSTTEGGSWVCSLTAVRS
jgi:hypothetical protein